MEVQLTPDQKAFIKHAIEAGRFNHEEDALKEALSLWEELVAHAMRTLELAPEALRWAITS